MLDSEVQTGMKPTLKEQPFQAETGTQAVRQFKLCSRRASNPHHRRTKWEFM